MITVSPGGTLIYARVDGTTSLLWRAIIDHAKGSRKIGTFYTATRVSRDIEESFGRARV